MFSLVKGKGKGKVKRMRSVNIILLSGKVEKEASVQAGVKVK